MAHGPNPAHYVLVFVNKVLLEHNYVYLHAVYGCFLAIMGEVSHCDTDCMTRKAYNIYYLALSRDSFNLWFRT